MRGVGQVVSSALPLLGYLYLCRVAVLCALVMVLFPWLSWLGPLRSLTVGAYEVTGWLQSALASMVFMVAGGGVIVAAEIHALRSGRRYASTHAVAKKALGWWRWLAFGTFCNIVWMIVASSVNENGVFVWTTNAGELASIASHCSATAPSSTLELVLGAMAGMLVCVILGGGAWTQIAPLRPVFDRIGRRWPRFSDWLTQRGIIGQDMKLAPLAALISHFKGGRSSWRGILKPQVKGKTPMLEQGQARMIIYTAILGILYIASLIYGDRLEKWLPPVSPVFFLIGVLCLALSYLTYLLDRHRVPLLLVCVGYCTFMTLWRESDHYYAVVPLPSPASEVGAPAPAASVPAEMSREYLAEGEKLGLPAKLIGRRPPPTAGGAPQREDLVVVVAMAGGGIQAAAWPLVAMKKIEELNIGGSTDKVPFHRRVRLVSGVSGGSVGAMYYASAFQGTAADKTPPLLDGAICAAMSSSLSTITMASLRDDFMKAVAAPLGAWGALGPSVLRDRGLALEQSFRSSAKTHGLTALEGATLSSWKEDALNGVRPALIFNGTVVETGERIAFSTVPQESGKVPGAVEFTQRYHADISMATAARLSATFPFVSPAARPLVTKSHLTNDGPLPEGFVVPGPDHWSVFPEGGSYHHVVDGGYFEVSAVVGALSWLEEACDQLARVSRFTAKDDPTVNASTSFALPRNILIVQMSGFPAVPRRNPVDEGAVSSGTVFDVVSPVVAAIGIRDSVQSSFSTHMVRLFAKRWAEESRRTGRNSMKVHHVLVQPEVNEDEWDKPVWKNLGFVPSAPPLSWHLRRCEQEAVRNQVAKSEPMDKKTIAQLKQDTKNWVFDEQQLVPLSAAGRKFVEGYSDQGANDLIRMEQQKVQAEPLSDLENIVKESTTAPSSQP